jgi:hypothetical protein
MQANKYMEVIKEGSNLTFVSIPIKSRMDLLMGNMTVMLNGQLQAPIEHYQYMLHPDYPTLVTGIRFEDNSLEPGDVLVAALEYRPEARAIEYIDKIDALENKRTVNIPSSKEILIDSKRKAIYVNGALQSESNYELIGNEGEPELVEAIDFGDDILEEEDIVHIIV